LDTVGHPTLFGTTFEFLRYFGLESLTALPDLTLPEANENGLNRADDTDGK
jgi:segregation and condensation protein B